MEELTSSGKEYVLDRSDTEVLYKKLESKDSLIEELQAEVETLRTVSYGEDTTSKEELAEKESEIQRLSQEITLKNNEISDKNSLLRDREKTIGELEKKINEKNSVDAGNNPALELELAQVKSELSEKRDTVLEQQEAIEEQQKVIAQKQEVIREKVAQLEAMEIKFGEVDKLEKELTSEKEKNEELREIQMELEDSLNDYERRLGGTEIVKKDEAEESLDLGDIFPVITDNSVLNARKICYIREIGENPWLEDIVCYLSAMLKSDLQNTQIEPYFIIMDDLSSDIRRIKYKEYDFTLNAVPAFGGAPESNVTVTSFCNIPDLKAHLNISNQEYLIIIDRYGKEKPFMQRRNVTEFNLVNNAELVNLCKLPKDETLVATFGAKGLVNSVELPTDCGIRGKRDRISLFLSKKAYTEMLSELKEELFK